MLQAECTKAQFSYLGVCGHLWAGPQQHSSSWLSSAVINHVRPNLNFQFFPHKMTFFLPCFSLSSVWRRNALPDTYLDKNTQQHRHCDRFPACAPPTRGPGPFHPVAMFRNTVFMPFSWVLPLPLSKAAAPDLGWVPRHWRLDSHSPLI